MTNELEELWRWYVAGAPDPSSQLSVFRIAFRLLKFFVLWSVFVVVLYKLMPREYWPFFKGIVANLFLLMIFPCLYGRGVLIDFLGTRLVQRASVPKGPGVLAQLGVLEGYRRAYGKSDFFYRLYVSLGWLGLGSMIVGGLYWFLSLR